MKSRREFLTNSAALAMGGLTASTAAESPKPFHLWACGDSHVGTDIKKGRESLAKAIRQSEFGDEKLGAPAFDWDIAVHVGDLAGGQGAPDDKEGREVVKQYGELKKHRREDVYDLAGNHDASGPDEETQWWFKKWVDPMGENTATSGIDPTKRRYPVSGTWERYSFRVGNMLFLIMSDRNDGGPPHGRAKSGGYPAGAVTSDTFEWWKQQVESNRDSIIICAHHHMLRETTVASGPFEGFKKNGDNWASHYHGYFPQGGPKGASYLYWIDDRPDSTPFENYLASNPGAVDLWLGGHTHTNPDDTFGGRSHIETKWGVNFINCAALSRYHAAKTTLPMSRRLSFTLQTRDLRVQCYLHTDQFAPAGFYAKAERHLTLSKPFQPA
ncbi:MAG: metallophosphoesterase [Verrucomicrobiales bacterium]|nr:metallophosphoesterase [Verrucomicrobiales bacterium]